MKRAPRTDFVIDRSEEGNNSWIVEGLILGAIIAMIMVAML